MFFKVAVDIEVAQRNAADKQGFDKVLVKDLACSSHPCYQICGVM